MTKQLGFLSLASVVVCAAAFALPKPRVIPGVTCVGAASAIYGLVQVADSTALNGLDATNDVSVVIGKPSTTPTLTLGSSGCKTTNGSTADNNYSGTSDYYKGNMSMVLSTTNVNDARIPMAVFFPNSTPNPGSAYSSIQVQSYSGSTTAPCAEGTDYFYKVCFLPGTTY